EDDDHAPGPHRAVAVGRRTHTGKPNVRPVRATMGGMAETLTPQREATEEQQGDVLADPDRPWITIVWDDPINLMSYVTHVFMTVFGYPQAKEERLVLDRAP